MEPTPLNYASPTPDDRKKRKPLLAWWGMIPVVIFTIAELIFTSSVAQARHSSRSDLAVSYMVGAILGGILISLIIAAIVYWASGKSQLPATIVFTVLLLLFALSSAVSPLRRRPGGTPARTPLAVSAPVRAFPSAGIAVDTPAGWQQVPAQKAGIVTQWVGPDSRPGDVRQMIIIQAGKGRADLPTTANALAAKWGGRVVNDHVNLDGETACLVQAEPTKPALQPVEGLVTMHNGNLYLVTGGVTPGHSCEAEFEAIRQSWKWIPFGSAAPGSHKP